MELDGLIDDEAVVEALDQSSALNSASTSASSSAETEAPMARLTLMSFGFKFGLPPANYYFDVSFLQNPARERHWGLFSTPSPEMREFVLQQELCQEFLSAVVPLIQVLLRCDGDVRVAFGCSAGRHRSAILVEEIARRVESEQVSLRVHHREEVYQ